MIYVNYVIITYQLSLIHELQNFKFKPGIMMLKEFPALSLLNFLEIARQKFHTLKIQIWCITQSRKLKQIHSILNRQSLGQPLCASLFQLRYQVHMRKCQQMDPMSLHLLFSAPKYNDNLVTLSILSSKDLTD